MKLYFVSDDYKVRMELHLALPIFYQRTNKGCKIDDKLLCRPWVAEKS